MSTLEVLRTAKARLEGGERFDFMDFTRCTCGHIYAAATGERALTGTAVMYANDGDYADVVVAAARALGWEGADGMSATSFISHATSHARDDDGSERFEPTHAITVIDRAIAAIEAEQERNRLDVLAQTREVIDNASVEVIA